tara:strand:- start:9956 stop:10948 length:993 start_codon:yes stop_codon:yes gene_type:complete
METTKYHLKDFQIIESMLDNISLPRETIDMIQILTNQVGSPNYIKTPVFGKKDTGANDTDRKRKKNNRMRPTDHMNNDDGAMSNIVFKMNQMTKKDGTDSYIQSIRALINKIGKTNNNGLFLEVFKIIDEFLETDITAEEVMQVFEKLTSILSEHIFYSDVYSNLFAHLLDKYEIMTEVFENKKRSYIQSYIHVQEVNPSHDYDLFCKINKQNEDRKAVTSFIANLYKKDKITCDEMHDITWELINMVDMNYQNSEKKSLIDEIIENVCVILNIDSNILKGIKKGVTSNNQPPFDFMVSLSQSKPKTYPGVTIKSLFKLMEAMEKYTKSI